MESSKKQEQSSKSNLKQWFHDFESTVKSNKKLVYLSTIGIAFLRTAVGFPIEHILDSVKTQWQAYPDLKNEWQITKHIYKTRGLAGLYAGGLPNFIRGFVKNAYRFPAVIAFPQFYNWLLPEKYSQDKSVIRGLTGLSIALSEVFLLNPLERLKVVSMTSKFKNFSYTKFFKGLKTGVFRELLKGTFPYFVRQLVTWVGFLQADVFFKLRARKLLNLKENEQIPMKSLLWVSLCVGLTTSIIYMPFDMIKTYMQMNGQETRMIPIIKNIYKQHGLPGFFTGWKIKTCQYTFIATCAVIILEKLEYWIK